MLVVLVISRERKVPGQKTDKSDLFAFFSNFVTAELLGIRRG